MPSPLSFILTRRHVTSATSMCRTWRNTNVAGANPPPVVFVTAATIFTVSPTKRRGMRLAAPYNESGLVTVSLRMPFTYTATLPTVTVRRDPAVVFPVLIVQAAGRPPPRPPPSPGKKPEHRAPAAHRVVRGVEDQSAPAACPEKP